MADIIAIIANIICSILLVFFIRAINRNTDARLQENEILKDVFNKLEELEKEGGLGEK